MPIFIWVPIFTKVLVRTEMGAYIHGVTIFKECLLSRFYSILANLSLAVNVGNNDIFEHVHTRIHVHFESALVYNFSVG